jgi:hypothetical protein
MSGLRRLSSWGEGGQRGAARVCVAASAAASGDGSTVLWLAPVPNICWNVSGCRHCSEDETIGSLKLFRIRFLRPPDPVGRLPLGGDGPT